MQQKQQLIKGVLGGVFLGGVVDISEAFRAIELTDRSLTAPHGAPCDGLRALPKICYNLLDKQVSVSLPDVTFQRGILGEQFCARTRMPAVRSEARFSTSMRSELRTFLHMFGFMKGQGNIWAIPEIER